MRKALIVGGDQIDGIRQLLLNYGVRNIDHWSGRKTGDGRKVVPADTELIVLVTDWISHSFTHKIKQSAVRGGVKIVYTPNGASALQASLKKYARQDAVLEDDCCRQTVGNLSRLKRWAIGFNRPIIH